MKRQIVVTNDDVFMKFVKNPLVADDVDSYEIVYDVGEDLTGCSFQVTAIRNGAGNVTDLGTVEGTVAKYTLKNNMYAILGNLALRLTIIGADGETFTSKELACQVIPGNGTNNMEGDDRYPVLTQLILEMQEAKIHLEEQIEELHEYSDNAADRAEGNAKDYTDEAIEALDNKFDEKGAALTAENNAKTYADGKAETAESNAKTYADGKATTAENNAKNYADGKATTAETNAKAYADTKASAAESNAKNYAEELTGFSFLDFPEGHMISENEPLYVGPGKIEYLSINENEFCIFKLFNSSKTELASYNVSIGLETPFAEGTQVYFYPDEGKAWYVLPGETEKHFITNAGSFMNVLKGVNVRYIDCEQNVQHARRITISKTSAESSKPYFEHLSEKCNEYTDKKVGLPAESFVYTSKFSGDVNLINRDYSEGFTCSLKVGELPEGESGTLAFLKNGVFIGIEGGYTEDLTFTVETGTPLSEADEVVFSNDSDTVSVSVSYNKFYESATEYTDEAVKNIPDGSVTTAKLANGAVTTEKLSSDIIEDLPVVGEHIIGLETDDVLRGELMPKVPSAAKDDVATFNNGGTVGDSGKKLSQFIEYTDTSALKKLLADAVPDTNNFPALRFTSKIPATSSDDGFKGEISFDSGFLYICIEDNSWKKVVLSDI